jgi:riboflavin kinase/FMN adenylyltransferase
MGDTAFLAEYAKQKNVPVYISEKVVYGGEKVSTSSIKQLLISGNVLQANEQLGYNFFIKGIVQEGRKQGREIGFPTANLVVESNRFCVKNGVYVVQTTVDGKLYKGIANVGSAPTFNFYQNVLEVHLKNFNGNLYGKEIRIEFLDYIRETVKFDCIEKLKEQLQKDLDGIKG